jgi:hypothetical protein
MLKIFIVFLGICVCSAEKCDWSNKLTFGDIFDPMSGLECVSRGEWPTHSRAPCDIDDTGFGGIEKVVTNNCLSTANGLQVICQSRIFWNNSFYITRLQVVKETLKCSCNEENNIEDCKWTVDLVFKPYQHDFSTLGKLLYTFGFLLGVYIITSIGVGGFFGGFLGAIFGNGFDDNRVTEGYGVGE